jgi:uncharacterized protein YjbI with pentapeptide repeats
VLWAVGIVIASVTIGLLVAKLYPGMWETISRERVATLLGTAMAVTVLIILLAMGGASLGWAGFANKTIWDWLELLIVPVALAGIGFLFTAQQDARQTLIEEQRAQDTALQAYLDQMRDLMIGQNSLRASNEDSELRTLARARTLTVLQGLDPFRKDTDLVQRVDERDPIIRLDDTVLSGTYLGGADLDGAYLNTAILDEADLVDAHLNGASLRGANLHHANLNWADLRGADLFVATLIDADLRGADLRDADLRWAYLGSADLGGPNVRGADLRGADLEHARGVTADQLAEAEFLEGATMPNGQKYEDWLKSKGSGEDGENGGLS